MSKPGLLQFKTFGEPQNAQPPRRMSDGAVGFDFWAEEIIHEDQTSIWYRTGYGVDLPPKLFGDLRARSSVSEMGLILANGAGVVDPDYQGEIQFRFYKNVMDTKTIRHGGMPDARDVDRVTEHYKFRRNVSVYKPGERIGQMVMVRHHTSHFHGVEVVDSFDEETERGEQGFGSTGNE